jgi:hypothetical protein
MQNVYIELLSLGYIIIIRNRVSLIYGYCECKAGSQLGEIGLSVFRSSVLCQIG